MKNMTPAAREARASALADEAADCFLSGHPARDRIKSAVREAALAGRVDAGTLEDFCKTEKRKNPAPSRPAAPARENVAARPAATTPQLDGLNRTLAEAAVLTAAALQKSDAEIRKTREFLAKTRAALAEKLVAEADKLLSPLIPINVHDAILGDVRSEIIAGRALDAESMPKFIAARVSRYDEVLAIAEAENAPGPLPGLEDFCAAAE